MTFHPSTNPAAAWQRPSWSRITAASLPALAALLSVFATGRSQQMVADLAPPPASQPNGSPTGGVTIQGIAFFAATSAFGRELWRTDGSLAGTRMVKDINPGALGSDPRELTVVGGRLFFSAEVTGYGRELWVSDGTGANTRLVRDIHPTLDPQLRSLVAFGGKCWFAADDGLGSRLWSSDGTRAGTRPLGAAVNPFELTVFRGAIYYRGSRVPERNELFRSDGTAAGTGLFVDIHAGPGSSVPTQLTVAGGRLFFTADDGVHGRELWSTDGTANGTRMSREIRPGTIRPQIQSVQPLSSGILLFRADDGTTGLDPWRSDGTAAGTYRLIDGPPLRGETAQFAAAASGSWAVFNHSDSVHGQELWRTDGTVAGTNLLIDLRPGRGGSTPRARIAVGNQVFFQALAPVLDSNLFVTDGTRIGTRQVSTRPGGIAPTNFTAFATGVLFRAAGTAGSELYRATSTSTGTTLVRDLWPATGSATPREFQSLEGRLFFAAQLRRWVASRGSRMAPRPERACSTRSPARRVRHHPGPSRFSEPFGLPAEPTPPVVNCCAATAQRRERDWRWTWPLASGAAHRIDSRRMAAACSSPANGSATA